ncbi:MAG: hypothetical protein H0V95_09550 [Actinobacteria bacterium]|nr:hypothetical protein [Actinomycetota bacterium]
MIKRLFWLTVGFGLGVLFMLRLTRAVRATVERYLPAPLAERLRALNAALDQRAREIRARTRPLRSVS